MDALSPLRIRAKRILTRILNVYSTECHSRERKMPRTAKAKEDAAKEEKHIKTVKTIVCITDRTASPG